MSRQVALPPTLAPRLINREAAAAYVNLSPKTCSYWCQSQYLQEDDALGLMSPPLNMPGLGRFLFDKEEQDAAIDAHKRGKVA